MRRDPEWNGSACDEEVPVGSPYLLALHGTYVIVGKEPDGDSVRFVADDPAKYGLLYRNHLIRPSRDGSVQLRFEGIDAPELHYGTAAQPLGREARDKLLSLMGFQNVVYIQPRGTMVKEADPQPVGGFILTKAADIHGRPIAYALLEDAGLRDGAWTLVDDPLLQRTLNAQMLDLGLAYYLGYTSNPIGHRRFLRGRAATARESQLGVWAVDSSEEFRLVDQSSIDPDGALIFPKLFRRCTDYLKAVASGFQGNLTDWMQSVSRGSRHEDDQVLLDDGTVVPFSSLILQRNDKISFQPDQLTVTFVEQ